MQKNFDAQIIDFKIAHADMFAWLYNTCCLEDNINPKTEALRHDILKLATILDVSANDFKAEKRANLLEYIRRKVGIKAIDQQVTKIDNCFSLEQFSNWRTSISKRFFVDLGAIEELLDNLVSAIEYICGLIRAGYSQVQLRTKKLHDELNVIMHHLKSMRCNMPLLLHIQTRIETSQAAKIA